MSEPSPTLSRLIRLMTLLLVLTAFGVAWSWSNGSYSVAAQGGDTDPLCEDINQCLIWGVDPYAFGAVVYEIDVCNKTVVAHGPFVGPQYQTAAANNFAYAIILGDAPGNTAAYPLPNGPPGAAAPGTIAPGATAFSEGKAISYSPV